MAANKLAGVWLSMLPNPFTYHCLPAFLFFDLNSYFFILVLVSERLFQE